MPLTTWDKAQFTDSYRTGAEGQWGYPNTRPEVKLNYHRFTQMKLNRRKARGLVEALSLTPAHKIVIVGAGFGWMSECLASVHGITQVVSLDSGAYIHSDKDLSEESELRAKITDVGLDPDIGRGAELLMAFLDGGKRTNAVVVNEDLLTQQSINNVKALIPQGKADYAITESVLVTLTDAEVVTLSEAMHKVAANVVHLTETFLSVKSTEDEPNPWNWKHINKLDSVANLTESQLWYTTRSWKALLPSDIFISIHSWEMG